MTTFKHISKPPESQYSAALRSAFIQPKLSINNPNDSYEQEADSVADKVMRMEDPGIQLKPLSISPIQRKCAACEEDEKKTVQRKEIENVPDLPVTVEPQTTNENSVTLAPVPIVQRHCAACEASEKEKVQRKEKGDEAMEENNLNSYVSRLDGGGQPLPNDVKNFYEPRFGYDFSNVKIHTDNVAAKSAQSINALAYTTGSNIVFNSGQYSPGTDAGKKLLGHELTHVIQQGGDAGIQTKSSAGRNNVIQRAYWMGVRPMGGVITGTGVHNTVLNDIGTGNPDLFTEAPIPNADLHSEGFDKIGTADFYSAKTTIGVTFPKEYIPQYLKSPSKLRRGGKPYAHQKNASPIYNKVNEISVDNAPSEILIGDLKPFGAEEFDPKYQEQISNYIKGIKIAQNEIKNLAVHPNKNVNRFVKGRKQWQINTLDEMSYGSLNIPDRFKIGSTSAPQWTMVLKEGSEKFFVGEGVTGRLYIAYRKDQKGIWNYIWAPDGPVDLSSVPQRVLDQQIILDSITLPLQDVRLQAKRKDSSTIKAKEIQRKTPANVPEKKDKFDLPVWEGKVKDFQKIVKAIPAKDKKAAEGKIKAYKAQEELHSKFHGIPAPKEAREDKKKIKTVKQFNFWSNPLAIHIGKFRKAFGTAFAKVYSAVEFIKEKVGGLLKSSKGGGGGLFGAVIRLFIKIFKIAGKFLFGKTIDLILNSMMIGVKKKLESFINDLVPDEAEQQVEKIKAIQAEFEAAALEEVTSLVEKYGGPFMNILEVVKEIESKARTVEKIVDLVRWGVRIIACASPPAIGCLWNLLQSVIERLAAKVVDSCWFTKKVGSKVAGALMAFDKIRNIPVDAASFIIDKINSMMPKGWEKTFPLPEKSKLAEIQPEYDGTCDEGGGGGSSDSEIFDSTRQEIFKTMEEVGEPKFNAMLQMLNAKAEGPWVLLTKDRLDKIKEDLKRTSEKDMEKVAKGEPPSAPLPESLEQLNKEVGKYTKEEKKVRGEHIAAEQTKADKQEQAAIAKALKIPFPAESKLVELMQAYDWSQLDKNHEDYIFLNNQLMIFLKTNNGARLAGFAKHIEMDQKGQKSVMIVDVSEFITLDPVQPDDHFAVQGKNTAGELEFEFEAFDLSKTAPPMSRLKVGHSFIKLVMRVK